MRKTGIILVMVCILFLTLSIPASAAAGDYKWHTFYGNFVLSFSIVIDSEDCAVITGFTNSDWNGPSGQSPLNGYSGGLDIMVLKLDADGNYLWHTFYGNSGSDLASTLALDSDDNIYITGSSTSTWDGPGSIAPLNAANTEDAVILKLDSDGAYQWHTFYGSLLGEDVGQSILVDDSNNIYIGINSGGEWAGFASPLNNYNGGIDMTVLKMDSAGAYQWHTFYGSSGEDMIGCLDLYNGSLYFCGFATDEWGSPQNSVTADERMVLVKLSTNGAYQWHTFQGGGYSAANGLDVDAGGIYLAGTSNTDNWTGYTDTPLNPCSSSLTDNDTAVLKLDLNGDFQWRTFFGAADVEDNLVKIKLDLAGDPCLLGYGGEWTIGSTSPLHAFSGMTDLFVAKLDNAGAYQWHTFYGSSLTDMGLGLALDSNDDIYATGVSYATWNGDDDAAPLNPYTGSIMTFVLKLEQADEVLPQGAGGEVSAAGSTVPLQTVLALAGLALFACGGFLTARRLFGR